MQFFQLHNVLMRNIPHYLDFIEKALFTLNLGLQILFRESFDCEFLFCFFIFYQINSGKRAFSYHFDCVIFFVEIRLDEHLSEGFLPLVQVFSSKNYKLTVFQVFNKSQAADSLISLFFLFNILDSDFIGLHQASNFLLSGGF